ncbi:MAG: MFS transporter [Solirubrobacterales bacterium]
MSAALRRSFSSLQIPNYRRYFAGQIVSLSGNWMQMVAEMWLVLELTGSGVAVGVTSALQFLPILVFGAWGGVIADRFPKRSLLIVTQSAMAAPAIALWGLTAAGVVEPWMVFALVFVRGAVNSIDNPTRQSFVIEMVGADQVVNAVGLNSVLIHSARILGPAGAGALIATVGVAPCFLVNAATFAAMIVALRGMDPARLAPQTPEHERRGGVREALAYVRGEPSLLIPLAMMALVGTLAFNFQVLLPLLGRFTYDGGAAAYTALAVAMAIGSVGGALATGARGRVSERLLVVAAVGFGLFALLAAAAPTLPLAMIALAPLGFASVTFAAGVNSTLQLGAEPAMRGRVMALYSVVFLGSTPIGGPIAGWLAEVSGPRAGLVLAGIAALTAAAGGAIAFARLPPLSGLDGRWWRWLGARGSVAVKARGSDELDGAEWRRGLDVEPDPVALLDRGDSVLAAAPQQGGEDRVARADHRDLGPDDARDSDQERERADQPQPLEHDPARALRGKAGGGTGRGKRRRHVVDGAGSGPEHEARPGGDRPPGEADDQRRGVEISVGDHDADRPERGGDGGDEQDGYPKQVAVEHQRARRRSRNPSDPSTTRSARR